MKIRIEGIEELYKYGDRKFIDDYIEKIEKEINKKLTPKKCLHCGNYFIPMVRNDEKYCDKVYDDGKTCKEVGAMARYLVSTSDDELLLEYRRLYKKYHAHIRYGKISKEYFKQWAIHARELRKAVQQGEITIEDFVEECEKQGGLKSGK